MNPLHELELGGANNIDKQSIDPVKAKNDEANAVAIKIDKQSITAKNNANAEEEDHLSSYEQFIISYAPFLNSTWSGWNIPDQKVIRAFNIIKVIYIFMLIPYHITCVASVVTNNRSYPSYDLPYPTTDHGLEYMAGLLFISGWLSHATTKPGTTFTEQMKKKLLRLLPTYYIGAIPLTLLCIVYEAGVGKLNGPSGTTGISVEFVLELFTLGSWNPALLFWTRNRPLWFISTLLTYHYCSTHFLTWVRGSSFNTVASALLLFVATRFAVACIILVCIVQVYPTTFRSYSRIIHLWSLDQIFLPFIGATLAEFSKRVGPLQWSRDAIWRLTDAVTVTTFALSCFVLSPPVWTDDFSQSLSGYYLDALCAYTNLLVMPLLLLAVYLYSHDKSTLTWIYLQHPKLFDEGLSVSYPLFLMHWPVMLMLQDSAAFITNKAVSVIMILATCILVAVFMDSYVVMPLEERIIAYVDPPKPKAKVPAFRPSSMVRRSLQNKSLREELAQKDLIINELEQQLQTVQELLEAATASEVVVGLGEEDDDFMLYRGSQAHF